MDFGVHLPQLGRQASRAGLKKLAVAADELGFHSGWVSDHVAWPAATLESKYPYTDDGSFPAGVDMSWLDPLGTLFFVAGVTERLKLGVTVLILGYRWPILTAKAWASLDVLSEGRAIVGVGVGWMREEFEVLGMPFDHRGARADEQLELYEACFTQDRPSYDGRYYQIPEIGFAPKPVQQPMPIWVGGDTEPAFRRTVKYGSAFHAAFQPIDEVAAAWARIGELATEAGRDPSEITLSIRLYLDPDAAMPGAKSVQGSAEQMADTIGRWRDIGVTHMLLDPVVRGGVDARIEAMEHLMGEVRPRLG
jgi:probable F420-dependent oxidoreductase